MTLKGFMKEKSKHSKITNDRKTKLYLEYIIEKCDYLFISNGKDKKKNRVSRRIPIRFYNLSVNYLRGITKEDCFIHDLMKRDINGMLVPFRKGKDRERECSMFQISLSIEEQKEKLPALKTIPYDAKRGQGRRVFLEKDDLWNCIMAAIDRVELRASSLDTRKVIYHKTRRYTSYTKLGTFKGCDHIFALKIPMPYDTYILSSSNWIKQYGSCWQSTNYHSKLHCSFYQAFEEKVRAKVFELK